MQRRRTHAVVVVSCGDIELASWLVAGDRPPDLATVDELAQIALAARRAGCSVRLSDPCPDLLALLDITGLRRVVGAGPAGPGGTAPSNSGRSTGI